MLINCPNCGKPVSDTAIECIHCKAPIKSKNTENGLAENKRDYLKLSDGARKDLLQKFSVEQSKWWRHIQTYRSLRILTCVFVLLSIAMLIPLMVLAFTMESAEGLDAFIAVMISTFVVLAVSIIMIVLYNAARTKMLVACKHLEKWLKKENVINFQVAWNSAKTAERYNQIKID